MSKTLVAGSFILILLIVVILGFVAVNNTSSNVNNSSTEKAISDFINSLTGAQVSNESQGATGVQGNTGTQGTQTIIPLSVQSASGINDGLILHLDFENNWTTSGILSDTSGMNNKVDCNLSLGQCPEIVPGINGSSAAEFNGSLCYTPSDYFAVNDSTIFKNMSHGTISLWAWYDDSAYGGATLIDSSGKPNNETPDNKITWWLGRDGIANCRVKSTRFLTGGYAQTGDCTNGESDNNYTIFTFPDDYYNASNRKWNNYAITWDGSNVYGYFNGKLFATRPWNDSFTTNQFGYIAVGAFEHYNKRNSNATSNCMTYYGAPNGQYYFPNNGFMKGKIDDVRIYNRSLSSSEIATLGGADCDAQSGKCWYVDQGALGVNDGSDWTNAWKNFSYINWANIKPGDVILISGGVSGYTYDKLNLGSGASGNASAPIKIKKSQEAGRNGLAEINGIGISGKYIEINGAKDWQFAVPTDVRDMHQIENNIGIKVTNLDQNQNAGIMIGTSSGPSIKLLWLEVSYNGKITGPLTRTNVSGIIINQPQNLTGFEVGYCWIHNNTIDGINNNGGNAPGNWDNFVIHHSVIEDNVDDGIQVGVAGLTIHHNIIGHVWPNYTWGDSDCFQQTFVPKGYFEAYDNILYDSRNSWVYNTLGAVENGEIGSMHFYGNVLYNEDDWWAYDSMNYGLNFAAWGNTQNINKTTMKDIYIVQNTFYNDKGQGVQIYNSNTKANHSLWNMSLNDVVIENNLLFNVSRNYQTGALQVTGDYNENDVVVNYNVVSGDNTGIKYMGRDYTNGSEMAANTIYKNNTETVPSFVKLSKYDFRLSVIDSAAKNKGDNLSYLVSKLPGLDHDLTGNPRGIDGSWDIGAYEYNPAQTECTSGQTQRCANQIGVCSGSTETCSVDGIWTGCDANNYQNNSLLYQQTETSCSDGLDNDCNGYADLNDQSCLPSICEQCSILGGNCNANTCHGIGNGRGKCYYNGGTNCFGMASACSSINNCSELNQYECKVGACGGKLDCRVEGSSCVEYDPSLLFHYDFENDFISGLVEDVSGNNRNGNCNASMSQCPIASTGPDRSGAAEFNGTSNMIDSDYIAIDNATDLNGLTNLTQGTIYLWAYSLSAGNTNGLLIDAKKTNKPGAWYLGRSGSSSNKFVANLLNGTKATVINFSKIVYNKWENYVITWDGTNISGYYNGALVNTASQADFPTLNVGTYIAIGADTNGQLRNFHNPSTNITYPDSGFFQGRMDEIRMYSRALSASEISDLYSTTIGKFSVSLVSPADGAVPSSKNVNFTCSASYNTTITNVTLYGNWAGMWKANGTAAIGSQSGSVTFSRTLNDGSYVWNCFAVTNTSEQAWAVSNYTLTVSTVPTGFNPADLDGDRYVSSTESLNYTLYYKRQLTWPIPPSPIDAPNWLFQRLLFKRGGNYAIIGSGCQSINLSACWTVA